MSELWTPDLDTQVTPEKAKKPATKWRNKWVALVDHGEPCDGCGDPGTQRGEVYFNCCEPFESRDLAETIAAEQIADDLKEFGQINDTYLGAFPVEGDA